MTIDWKIVGTEDPEEDAKWMQVNLSTEATDNGELEATITWAPTSGNKYYANRLSVSVNDKVYTRRSANNPTGFMMTKNLLNGIVFRIGEEQIPSNPKVVIYLELSQLTSNHEIAIDSLQQNAHISFGGEVSEEKVPYLYGDVTSAGQTIDAWDIVSFSTDLSKFAGTTPLIDKDDDLYFMIGTEETVGTDTVFTPIPMYYYSDVGTFYYNGAALDATWEMYDYWELGYYTVHLKAPQGGWYDPAKPQDIGAISSYYQFANSYGADANLKAVFFAYDAE